MALFYSQEFNPDLQESIYKRSKRNLMDELGQTIGDVRSQALNRGLEGDYWEAIQTANAKQGFTDKLADIYTNLATTGAEQARQERLSNEQNAWQEKMSNLNRDWQTQEAEKNRQFNEKMAILDWNMRKKLMKEQNKMDWNNSLKQGLINSAISFVGGLF